MQRGRAILDFVIDTNSLENPMAYEMCKDLGVMKYIKQKPSVRSRWYKMFRKITVPINQVYHLKQWLWDLGVRIKSSWTQAFQIYDLLLKLWDPQRLLLACAFGEVYTVTTWYDLTLPASVYWPLENINITLMWKKVKSQMEENKARHIMFKSKEDI